MLTLPTAAAKRVRGRTGRSRALMNAVEIAKKTEFEVPGRSCAVTKREDGPQALVTLITGPPG